MFPSYCRLPGLLASIVACTATGAYAASATLMVDVAAPAHAVSPTLWGLFFEEINHAGDGGLYAELVRNRAFEDADEPAGWTLLTPGGAAGAMALDRERPLNAATPTSLRIDRHGDSPVAVANEGYWGMGLREGHAYALSLYARCGVGRAALRVRLEGPSGLTLAEGSVGRLDREWKRFHAVLVPTDSTPNGRLVIEFGDSGRVWLDCVSLFPRETFHRRPNGLRPDLADMLDDMRPSFARFPGGCFVEGDRLANAFRWKHTIGDIAERPGHWNLWQYRSTDGLGYHEYLQMCEDLGAEPLFVINCGMAHEDVVPMDALDEWVRDALDAIEYANGPPDSEWGTLRARNGHEEPFGLKYLEIGNENGGPAYEERYARFYNAIKARYPEMQLIANVPVTSAPMDILDEHYYSSPEWFASQAYRYDGYDRGGPRIYVGEYACTSGCGQGNLQAALGEAAFMTGIERNSDVVVMASYAPLFVNVNDRRWNPDAIGFDSASCYGTPSYHVQKLFSRNRPDEVLNSTLTCPETSAEARGAIGLSTWSTQAEFADVRVTSGDQVRYASDFARGADGWRVLQGEWRTQDGAYRQTGAGNDSRAVVGDPTWTDYTLTLRARKLGGAEGFLIMFHVRDDANWLWWNIGGWGNVRHAIEKCTAGAKQVLGSPVPGSVDTGRWYDVRIEAAGTRIRCYLDGKLIHDVQDTGPAAMAAAVGRDVSSGDIIVKVVNLTGEVQDTEITLDGAQHVAPKAHAIVLTSNNPNDENSLSEPTRVAPVELDVHGVAPVFRYPFLSHSLTILRIEE